MSSFTIGNSGQMGVVWQTRHSREVVKSSSIQTTMKIEAQMEECEGVYLAHDGSSQQQCWIQHRYATQRTPPVGWWLFGRTILHSRSLP